MERVSLESELVFSIHDTISLSTILMTFSVVHDKSPLPQQAASQEEDDALFQEDPYIEAPVRIDYGTRLR